MASTHTIIRFTIEAIERRTKPGRMAGLAFDSPATQDQHGWFARVGTDTGSVELSKLDGEVEWAIDATFGPTGLPGYMNGYGARYCALRRPVAEVANALEELCR